MELAPGATAEVPSECVLDPGVVVSAVPKTDIQEGLDGAQADGKLKGKLIRGGAVTMAGQGLNFVLQLGSTVVLARLLSSTDYGLQGMVLTLTGLFNLVKDAGLSVATVQQRTLTNEQASTLFWISNALGALLTVIVAACGPLLVIFYREPRLLWVTVASSSVFLLNSMASQHRALLNRAMRFTTIAKIDMVAAIAGYAIGIAMAIRGFGYWALIGQAVGTAAVSTVGHWVALPWLPGRPHRNCGIGSMIRFGSTLTLNSFVVYLAYNTEKILLGRFWGVQQLGIYGRAYSLANLPVQQLLNSAGAVAFPLLSRMQNDAERLRRTFLRSLSLIVSLVVPAAIFCSLFAADIIASLLGPKWAGVAPVVRMLTPTMLVFALINPLSWFLQATGRVRRSLNLAFLICPAVILGILAGLRYGPTGVATGYSSAMLLLVIPVIAWAKRGTEMTTQNYWEAVKRPLYAGAVASVPGWVLILTLHAAMSPVPFLLLGLTTCSVVYAFFLLVVFGQKEIYMDLWQHFMQRIRPA